MFIVALLQERVKRMKGNMQMKMSTADQIFGANTKTPVSSLRNGGFNG